MKKANYSNVIYGLDIETSTIPITEDEKCSFMYSACVGRLDVSTGIYTNEYRCRTYDELSDYLYELNEEAENLGVVYIVYIHNLAYEMSFFQNNVKFFTDHNKEMSFNDVIYLSKNKPLSLRVGSLQFRCSLQLLSKKIKDIGEDIGLPKLDYDYDELRTPLTPLTKEEIEYNYRDVEIMLKGVYRLVNNNEFITKAGDIPYTKTGLMRFNCEKNPEINVSTEYIDKKTQKKKKRKLLHLNNYLSHIEKAQNEQQLEFWENLFQGGLVYSNPKYTGSVLYNVASYDFSSDYPFQMLTRKYPSKFEEVTENKMEMFLMMTKYLDETNLIRNQVSANCFNAVITIKDVKCKFDFQPLSTAKIINIDDLKNTLNCTVINGKILECDTEIKIMITIIDFIMLKLFYDYELVDVNYLERATAYKYSNQYKMNSVLFNAKAKIEYKQYNNLVEEMGEFHQYTKAEIDSDYYREKINNSADYYDQLNTSHTLYQAVKSDLNALYGDNAQHLRRENYLYDINSRDFIEHKDTFEDYANGRQKTSYIYGLYTPAFARASILYIAYKFCEEGIDVLYIDTDSIKVEHSQKADELVSEFNEIQYESLGENKFTRFGQLEREYVADKFVSLGTKSYIKMENDVLKATISGLPNASVLFNELLDVFDGGFEEMIENCYHYGTVFDRTVCNKLASKYQYRTYEIDVDGYTDTVVSGVVLEEVEVTMRDISSETWYSYARLTCSLYNKSMSSFAYTTRIMRNPEGRLEVYNA